jgi:hypothetical protein
VLNSPLRYTDPTGHSDDCAIGEYGCEVGKLSFQGLVHLWTDYSGRFTRDDIYSLNPPKEFALDLAYNVRCPGCHQWTPEDVEKYLQETDPCYGVYGTPDCIRKLWEFFKSASVWPLQKQGDFPPNLVSYNDPPPIPEWIAISTTVDALEWLFVSFQNHTPQPQPLPIPTPPTPTPPQKTPGPR